MSKNANVVIAAILGIFCAIFGFFTKLTIPTAVVLAVVKVFYSAYPLGWLATVAIPIVCGAVCWILTLATAIATKYLLGEI